MSLNQRAKLDAAKAAFESALDALHTAAEAYAKAETRAYSKAHPLRRVEALCGNGARLLLVEVRGKQPDGAARHYTLCASGERTGGHTLEQPEFMDVLDKLEDEHRLPGIGGGCFAFKNGKAVK